MRPDCPHDLGFSHHVADRGGHHATCDRCKRWVWLDRNGKVAQYVPKNTRDVNHAAHGASDDASDRSQTDTAV